MWAGVVQTNKSYDWFSCKNGNKLKIWNSRNQEIFVFTLCEFLSSKFNLLCFFFSFYGYLWFRLVHVRKKTADYVSAARVGENRDGSN